MSLIQIIAAIAMLIVAFLLVFGYWKYLRINSERRMLSMLEALGIDPAIASSGDTEAIMKEVRNRCRACSSESVCEEWLKGDHKQDNAFCPNAKVFEMFDKQSRSA